MYDAVFILSDSGFGFCIYKGPISVPYIRRLELVMNSIMYLVGALGSLVPRLTMSFSLFPFLPEDR